MGLLFSRTGRRILMAVAPRVQIEMQVVSGELAVQQLDATDLDDAVTVFGGKTGGLGIQENLSHGSLGSGYGGRGRRTAAGAGPPGVNGSLWRG